MIVLCCIVLLPFCFGWTTGGFDDRARSVGTRLTGFCDQRRPASTGGKSGPVGRAIVTFRQDCENGTVYDSRPLTRVSFLFHAIAERLRARTLPNSFQSGCCLVGPA